MAKLGLLGLNYFFDFFLDWMPRIVRFVGTFTGGEEKAKEIISQKLPGFLGIGLADERLWLRILEKMEGDKRLIIVRFNELLSWHEQWAFRQLVTSMTGLKKNSADAEKKDESANSENNPELADIEKSDPRITWLSWFASFILELKQKHPGQENILAWQFLREAHVFGNPIPEWAKKMWFTSLLRLENSFLRRFGIESIEELNILSEEEIARRLNIQRNERREWMGLPPLRFTEEGRPTRSLGQRTSYSPLRALLTTLVPFRRW